MTNPLDFPLQTPVYEPEDILPYASDMDPYQDVNDPVWTSSADIADMTAATDNDADSQEMLRRSDGVLEFLNNIIEDIDVFEERENVPQKRKKPMPPIRTKEYGSDKWRGRTATVDATTGQRPLVEESVCRRRILIVNTGTKNAYLFSMSPVAGNTFTTASPPPNAFVLLPTTATAYIPLELQTRDNIYAVCQQADTTTLTLIEEFDLEY